MLPILIADWLHSQLWYSVPLVVSISLVYGATRHEEIGPILHHSWHTGKWIVGFIAIIMAILWAVSWAL